MPHIFKVVFRVSDVMFLVISRAFFEARIILELFIYYDFLEIKHFRKIKTQVKVVKNVAFTIPSGLDRVSVQSPLGPFLITWESHRVFA